MKTKNKEKEITKFNLEKFEIAKLKNLHLIIGGGDGDPIDTNDTKIKKESSEECHR